MTSLEFDTLRNCRLCYIHTVIIRVPFLFLFISWNHTGTNVLSYVNMACASLRNSIPKSVVHCQVREAKRSLLDHFFTELGKKEVRIPTYPTHSFTFLYRNKTLFQVLSITFFFFCSQDIWPNCSMRIQQSCNAAPALQKGWNYIEMPKQRLMQLLGPSRRKQISLFLRSWILFFLATSQGP